MGIVTQYAWYRSNSLFQIHIICNDLHLKLKQVFYNKCCHLNCWGLFQTANKMYVFKLAVLCPWRPACIMAYTSHFFDRLPLVSSEYNNREYHIWWYPWETLDSLYHYTYSCIFCGIVTCTCDLTTSDTYSCWLESVPSYLHQHHSCKFHVHRILILCTA